MQCLQNGRAAHVCGGLAGCVAVRARPCAQSGVPRWLAPPRSTAHATHARLRCAQARSHPLLICTFLGARVWCVTRFGDPTCPDLACRELASPARMSTTQQAPTRARSGQRAARTVLYWIARMRACSCIAQELATPAGAQSTPPRNAPLLANAFQTLVLHAWLPCCPVAWCLAC